MKKNLDEVMTLAVKKETAIAVYKYKNDPFFNLFTNRIGILCEKGEYTKMDLMHVGLVLSEIALEKMESLVFTASSDRSSNEKN